MQLNIDPVALRDQAKLLTKLSSLLDEAAIVCDQINGSKKTSLKGSAPLSMVENGNSNGTNGSHRFLAGSRKANLDLAEKILKAAGKPMHQMDVLHQMMEAGCTLSKGNTVAVYLKADKRFEKGQKRGFWKLSGRSPE